MLEARYASPRAKVPLGAFTANGKVVVRPALVYVIVLRPEKVCVCVPETVTAELRLKEP